MLWQNNHYVGCFPKNNEVVHLYDFNTFDLF